MNRLSLVIKPQYTKLSCVSASKFANNLCQFRTSTSSLLLSSQCSNLLRSNVRTYASEVPVIPEPPIPPLKEPALNALGEPTFSSLGLNSYWPSGWFQWCIESIHVSLDLPWWAAISATTLVIRLCLFPLIINQRRNIAKYTSVVPELNVLQENLTNARLSGNYVEVVRISKEIKKLVTENDINPLKTFKLLFVQVPLFLSVFTGLRGMANLPVNSMQTGGLFWFTDLTVPDPYYILPLISMASIWIMLEKGVDMPTNVMTPVVRSVVRVFPVVGFVMVMNMPSALLWYWTISNAFSLAQFGFLRLSAVRRYFNLVDVVQSTNTIEKKRGFVEGFKESVRNTRLLAELENRERLDAKAWRNSGSKVPPTTFRRDPTKINAGINERDLMPRKQSNQG